MLSRLHLLALVLFSAPVSSQVFEETFGYPDGPIIPGWTQHRGVWTVVNQRVASTSGVVWAYMTKDGFSAKDSVLDCDVFYAGSGIQFAGVTSRHPGTTLDANMILAKVQDNGGSPDLDSCWLYERGFGTPLSKTSLPGMQSARCRLITLDNTAHMLLDADSNGTFETDVGTRPLTTVLASGLVGLTAFQSSQVDNFRYFDAVLVAAPSSTPTIGTTYTMQLRAPQPQNTVFFCAASLRNTGIPIDSRKLPLSVDALLQMSLATPAVFGFVGLLDANGDGAPKLHIPNDRSLVGFSMFVAGVTLVASAPSGIGNISNDHHVVIQ